MKWQIRINRANHEKPPRATKKDNKSENHPEEEIDALDSKICPT